MSEVEIDQIPNECQETMNLSLKSSLTIFLKPKLISSLNKIEKKNTLKKDVLFQKTTDSVYLKKGSIAKNQSVSFLQSTGQSKRSKSAIQTIEFLKRVTICRQEPIERIDQRSFDSSNSTQSFPPKMQFYQIAEKGGKKFLIQQSGFRRFKDFIGRGALMIEGKKIIQGHFQTGKIYGPVQIKYKDKSTYHGEINETLQREGKGFIVFKDSSRLQVSFRKGWPIGEGRLFSSEGKLLYSMTFKRGLVANFLCA